MKTSKNEITIRKSWYYLLMPMFILSSLIFYSSRITPNFKVLLIIIICSTLLALFNKSVALSNEGIYKKKIFSNSEVKSFNTLNKVEFVRPRTSKIGYLFSFQFQDGSKINFSTHKDNEIKSILGIIKGTGKTIYYGDNPVLKKYVDYYNSL